jgi:hypothetical protein
VKSLVLAMVASIALTMTCPASAAVKTVVLVHGAFSDGSGWKPVADILERHGYAVRAVQEPLTSFEDDLAATRRVLDKLDPCVLVGHSYAGGYRFFAGWRSDPFFFDTKGALNDLQFTGDDFFADKDVCSIVLEVPNSVLGRKRIGLWARTLKVEGGVWVQADRGGLPAQAVFLVGGGDRDAYLAGEPSEDARFVRVFAHALEHAGGYTPEEARRVAETLLPDVLSYDPTRPASFPVNGRTLTDDAADAFLAVLTNGRVTGDKVGAHSDLLTEFPYLGPPHNV